MAPPLLSVAGLTKSFGSRKVVDNVIFKLNAGQTLGLLGPNGAGKSTTVGMICGLLAPDAGEVLLDGEKITAGSSLAKRKLGLVPQDLALYDDLSALENLRLFGALYGLKGGVLRDRCAAMLKLVSLDDRAGDKPATFSGGMKRRLNIAAALLHDPALLILDEPTVGVDPQSRNAIFDSLETLKAEGRALIYTSHYMEEVERLADQIVIIDHGRVIANATPAQLHSRLPSHATLNVELEEALTPNMLAALRGYAEVADAREDGLKLAIALHDSTAAVLVLEWLKRQGITPLHFSTGKVKLEDIFLHMTGRALRD